MEPLLGIKPAVDLNASGQTVLETRSVMSYDRSIEVEVHCFRGGVNKSLRLEE